MNNDKSCRKITVVFSRERIHSEAGLRPDGRADAPLGLRFRLREPLAAILSWRSVAQLAAVQCEKAGPFGPGLRPLVEET